MTFSMLVAARTPVQVGAIVWPGTLGTATVVIARTFDLVPRGVGGPSQDQDPLRLDTLEGGLLLFPSDFAPTRSACDVLLVGRALHGTVGPVRVVVDPLRVLVERASQLGPRPGVGDLGDPTDPAVGAAWTQPSFDFDAFHAAPRERRLPFPSLPLDVVVDFGETRFVTRIEGPVPEVLQLDPAGWTAPTWVALRVDQVGIDPDRRKIGIVWRGLVSFPEGVEPLVAVEVGASLRSLQPWEMLRWPRAHAIEPRVLRRLARLTLAGAPGEAPRGIDSVEDGAEEELAASTLTLKVAPPAVVATAVGPEGPSRTADPEAPTMAPAQLLGATGVKAPTFGPPPGLATPPARVAAELEAPTRISQTLSRSEIQAAIAAHRGAPVGPRRVDPSRTFGDGEPDVLGTSTVQVAVPPQLRAGGLPFSAGAPLAARASLGTISDEAAPAAASPTGPALPFVRTPAATRPLPEPPPPPRPPANTSPEVVDASPGDALVGTLASNRSPAAGLPFRRAPSTRPPPPMAPPTGTAPIPFLGPAATAVPFAPPPLASPALAPPRVPASAAPPVALPFVAPPVAPAPVPPPSAVLLGVAARLGASPAPEAVSRETSTTSPGAPDAATVVEGISAERFAEIKAALWADVEGRRATLEKHGLTELKWRLVERRFVADLARRRPEEVRAVRDRLRQVSRRLTDA